MENISKIKGIFLEYTERYIEKYPSLRKNLQLKINHSFHVADIANYIAESVNGKNINSNLAMYCGIFHDIGRFEQYAKYKTFSDDKSQDHGTIGSEVFSKLSPQISDITTENLKIINTAILYHNKKTIPISLSKEELLYTKITRDADKVDIYNILCKHYTSNDKNSKLTLDLTDDNNINPICLESLLKQEIIDKKHLITVNDFKMLQLSWVFDIYFKSTLSIIKKENYLNIIISTLPESKEKRIIENTVLNYLNNAN